MTSDPASDMDGVVQKPERHRDPVIRADMPRRPHQTMSSRINVTANDGDCCHTGWMAGTVLRNDVDRIDPIMTMHGVRSRIRPGPQQAACYGKQRPGKAGIPLHLDLTLSRGGLVDVKIAVFGGFWQCQFPAWALEQAGTFLLMMAVLNSRASKSRHG